MVASCVRIAYENLRELAFGDISGNYAAVGPVFANPVRMLKVTNDTDANLYISFNGVDNMDIITAESAFIYDFGSNKADAAGLAEQPAAERLYVKEQGGAPTAGNVYVTVIYLDNA